MLMINHLKRNSSKHHFDISFKWRDQFCDSRKDLIIKSSNRETPEKQIVKTDQNGNEETKGEMEVMLPDNELYKFIEIQPIDTIFREQVSYFRGYIDVGDGCWANFMSPTSLSPISTIKLDFAGELNKMFRS